MSDAVQRGPDGYYHPNDVAEVQWLVRFANGSVDGKRRSLRVRGSAHSVPGAIYSTGYRGDGPPPDDVVEVMLDRLRRLTITPEADPSHAAVRVEAGCHLGLDPYDPTKTSTWENSLDWQLQERGYALADTGGITHQTVAGFLATGSSGGSLTHAVGEQITAYELVDGTGALHVIDRGDPRFPALGVHLGLLGVVVAVSFRVGRTFDVFGDQVTVQTSDPASPVDLFAPNASPKSLANFLKQTPYTRLMWWPQHDFERVQIWRAGRAEPVPRMKRNPYRELGRAPQLAALAGSLVYTVLGNLDDVSVVPSKLEIAWFDKLAAFLTGEPNPDVCPCLPGETTTSSTVGFQAARHPDQILKHVFDGTHANLAKHPQAPLTSAAAPDDVERFAQLVRDQFGDPPEVSGHPAWDAFVHGLVKLLELVSQRSFDTKLAQLLADGVKLALPWALPYVLGLFVSIDREGTPFWDSWRCGLPMDNQMDDLLWPTEFTELWIPLEHCDEAMNRLQKFYAGDGTARGALKNTGTFSCEIYAAKASETWLSPAYGTDVLRVDVFWFGLNAGTPETFYQPFWDLLKDLAFRPHWGKWLPPPSDAWRAHYASQLPLDAFLKLRAELDPQGVFATDYWRGHFGF
ncbi:MAG: D-arabinono-1,4-lactone oxidase [Polyangiales bacterium]